MNLFQPVATMNTIPSILLLSFTCLSVALAAEPGAGLAEIERDDFIALKIHEKNAQQKLPALNYWGLGGLEWESTPAPSATAATAAKSNWAGLPCTRELRNDARGLAGVRYSFAQGVTDREERL